DNTVCRRELRRFVETARRGRGSIELFQGMAGRLAGAAIIMRTIPDPEVRVLGDLFATKILGALEGPARLAPQGMAHGQPGVVLAALTWQAVSGALPKAALAHAVTAAHANGLAA